MRKSALVTFTIALLAAIGCDNQWDLKWPNQTKTSAAADSSAKPAPKPAKVQPPLAKNTPQQEIVQLQRQIKTLRQRLEVIENENGKLRQSYNSVAALRKELEKQTFTAKMQAEDLKALRTAAIERDLYKTRSERLQRQLTALKAPSTRPAGP